MPALLFVCLGNICRSPTAEGVFRHLLGREASARDFLVDSAGTANYHVGDPPDPRSQKAAARRGIDLSGLRARQLHPSDYERFDLILAMDKSNLRALGAQRPKAARAQLHLFLEYAGVPGEYEVPDPYYGGDVVFERVLDLAISGSQRLIAAHLSEHR